MLGRAPIEAATKRPGFQHVRVQVAIEIGDHEIDRPDRDESDQEQRNRPSLLDAVEPGQKVIIVDDLLATGGTMEATVKLVQQLGGHIAGLGFAVELDFVKGRDKFKDYDVFSLLHYNE